MHACTFQLHHASKMHSSMHVDMSIMAAIYVPKPSS
jgi:hypothetical protein